MSYHRSERESRNGYHLGPDIVPTFEGLENRLLLDAAPTFANDLADYYSLDSSGGLTIGIDGDDADLDDVLTVDVSFADGATGLSASIYDSQDDVSYAVLHFEDGSGNAIGDILVQLFDDRSPLAVERFITLSENYIDADGNSHDPTAENPAFYTDVLVHRVINEFMMQTGDAENGNGTGGSPLGDFDDQFHEDLSFAGIGALAMANSGDDTNDSQWFITDVPTPHLNGDHTIFGQVISGWDVYEQIINTRTNSSDKPYDAITLASVDILDDSNTDGTVTLTATDSFTEPTDVTITLTDSTGQSVSQTVTLVPADDVAQATVGDVSDVTLTPGGITDVSVPITYTGDKTPILAAHTQYYGEGEITVTLDDPAEAGDPYMLHIELPDEYDGETFTIHLAANIAEFDNLKPDSELITVSIGDSPTIEDPGRQNIAPSDPFELPLTITDDNATEFTVTYETDNDDVTVEIDPVTYVATITPPDSPTVFTITFTAVETAYAGFSDLDLNSTEITFSTRGEAPTIEDPGQQDIAPTDPFELPLAITDDDAADFTVTYETDNDDVTVEIDPDTYVATITPPDNLGAFTVTFTAVETIYADVEDIDVTPTEITFTTLGDRPTMTNTDETFLYLNGGETQTFDLGVTDDSDTELQVTVISEMNGSSDDYVSIETIVDEDTGETHYWATIDMTSLPESFSGVFKVRIEAIEKGYDEIVEPGVREFRVVSSNEYDPDMIGFVDGESDARVAKIVGDRLYLGTTGGLEVFDISDPTNPTLLGSFETTVTSESGVETEHEVLAVTINGGYAYIAVAYGGYEWDSATQSIVYAQRDHLLSLDVSDPATEIVQLQEITSDTNIADITLYEDRMYLSNWKSGLAVYSLAELNVPSVEEDGSDVAEPLATITKAGSVSLGYVTDVVISGDYAYVTDALSQLVTLNIGDLDNVLLASRVSTNAYGYVGQPAAIAMSDDGTQLFVADSATGLFSYDLTDQPGKPTIVGWLGWPATDLMVMGSQAVISDGGYHRFVDISDPSQMSVTHFHFAPDYIGPSDTSDPDLFALVNGSEGVTLLQASNLLESVSVFDTRTIQTDEGPVTFTITGGGIIRVYQAEDGAIDSIEIIDSTDSTGVIVTTPTGQTATIGEINVYGSLYCLRASTTTLAGNMHIQGEVRDITLAGVGAPGDPVEQTLTIDGTGVIDPSRSVSLSLGAVSDLTIDSAMPIRSLRATEWLDDETGASDAVVAPSLGSLAVRASGDATGNFQADLTLNEDGTAPTASTLGAVSISGQLSQADWIIRGQAHSSVPESDPANDVTVLVDDGNRDMTVYNSRTITFEDGSRITFRISGGGQLRLTEITDGHVGAVEILNATSRTSVTVTGYGDDLMIGDIHADTTLRSIQLTRTTLTGDIHVEGGLTTLRLGDVGIADDGTEQTITIDGDPDANYRSTIAMTFDSVYDLSIDSGTPISTLTVDQWLDNEDPGSADTITAPSINALNVRPPRGVAADFQADLVLNENGNTPKALTLGRATIAGELDQANWTIYGPTGTIRTGSDGDDAAVTVDTTVRPTTVYDRRVIGFDDDGDGIDDRTITLSISGGGILRITPDEDGVYDIGGIEVVDGTNTTSVRATVRGGTVTVEDITAASSLSTIYLPQVTLVGDLNVSGTLSRLTLGNVGDSDNRREQLIKIGTGTKSMTISLGAVSDARIDSATPIRSLKATEWIDNESGWEGLEDGYQPADKIKAPSIGTLTIRPSRNVGSGDFQADLELNTTNNSTERYALSRATIAGTISDASWDVQGDVGTIIAGATAESWSVDATTWEADDEDSPTGPASIRSITTNGDMAGDISASEIRSIRARGTFSGTIVTTGGEVEDRSINSFYAYEVNAATFNIYGGIQTISVGALTDSTLTVDWISNFSVTGRHGSGNLSGTITVNDNIRRLYVSGDIDGSANPVTLGAASITSMTVRGDVMKLNMDITDELADGEYGLRTLYVTGRISDSRLLVAGNIRTVTAGAMTDTDLYAGYVAGEANEVTGLPTSDQLNNDDQFEPTASIYSLTVRGIREDGVWQDSFVSSNIAASVVRTARLAYAATDPADDADPFGITTKGMTSYRYTDADRSRSVSWNYRSAGDPPAVDNLIIRIV